ncbi:MAG: hypothetical protein WB503_16585, partial [Pseudolabrys sp.]
AENDVRSGSLATDSVASDYVRSTPDNGQQSRRLQCPLSARRRQKCTAANDAYSITSSAREFDPKSIFSTG